MRHSFLKMVAIALVAVGFVACGEKKSPIEVETFTENKMMWGGIMYENYYVRVRAVDDSVTIQKIIVNRGNCGEYDMDINIKFGETTRTKIGDTGNGCSLRNVKEVQVATDKGTWTFNW